MTSLIRATFIGSVTLGSTLAPAAVFGPLTFEEATDYTANFVSTPTLNLFAHDSASETLQYKASSNTNSGTSIIRYQTTSNPAGPNDFLTETMKLDVTFNTYNSSPSFGMLTRIQADNNGVLALLNNISNSSVRLRLFYGSSATSNAAGTVFHDQTVTLTGNLIAVDMPLTMTLTQSSGNDPVFNLTVSDAQGTVASTGNVALIATDAYNDAGGIALRGAGSWVGTVVSVDNFIVPEPVSAAGLVLMGAALLRRRSRR